MDRSVPRIELALFKDHYAKTHWANNDCTQCSPTALTEHERPEIDTQSVTSSIVPFDSSGNVVSNSNARADKATKEAFSYSMERWLAQSPMEDHCTPLAAISSFKGEDVWIEMVDEMLEVPYSEELGKP